MKGKTRRIIAFGLAVVLIAGISVFALDITYPDAMLKFTGLTLQTLTEVKENEHGDWVTVPKKDETGNDIVIAALDVNLYDVKAWQLAYVLSYNSAYVVPFDMVTETDAGMSGNGIIPNDTIFGSELSITSVVGFPDPAAPGTSYKTVMQSIVVDKEQKVKEEWADYGAPFEVAELKNASDYKVLLTADSSGLKLGTMYFRVLDPVGLAKMNQTQLESIFKIAKKTSDSYEYAISYISNPDASDYNDASGKYSEAEHLGFKFEIDNPVSFVDAVNKYQTVSAADIYGLSSTPGTGTDLISYLNLYMRDVVISYADTTRIMDTIEWGDVSKGFSVDPAIGSWDPKGGGVTYTVSQEYNADFTIEAQVTVTSANVIGYTTDKEYIAYAAADAPTTKEALDLPTTARVVFDVVSPKCTNYTVGIKDDTWTPDTSTTFPTDGGGAQEYTANIDEAALPAWATYTDTQVKVSREVTDNRTENPVVAPTIDGDGVMTLGVTKASGDPWEIDTEFELRMPNGETINPDLYEVDSTDPTNIQIKLPMVAGTPTDEQAAQLERLKEYINMGDGAGDFTIRAKEPSKTPSDWVAFPGDTELRRTNEYTKNVEFDYRSSVARGAFPFYVNGMETEVDGVTTKTTGLPLTITLPNGDTVPTTYSGVDGTEPGALKTVTVDSWSYTDTDGTPINAEDITAGMTILATGRMADTTYGDYGAVTNPSNFTITLKLDVLEENEHKEEIEPSPMPDFQFDRQMVGYPSNKLQTKQFTITNSGLCDIAGLHITISTSDFKKTADTPYILKRGDTATFAIGTILGLPAGPYDAVVNIGSNRTPTIASFHVKFEVTDEVLYKVTLITDDPSYGKAESFMGTTATTEFLPTETVSLVATPSDDVKFVGWEVQDGYTDVSFDPDDITASATFAMPEHDVTIKAKFEPTDAFYLRLDDLNIYDMEGNDVQLLDADYNILNLKDGVYEYYARLPYTSVQSSADVVLRNLEIPGIGGGAGDPISVSASVEYVGGTLPTASPTVTQDGTTPKLHVIDSFDIEKRPADNVLIITLSGGDDGTGHPCTKQYKVHIHLDLAPEDMAEFLPGNSPYGLIMGASNIAEADKETAKQAFDDNYNRYDPSYVPIGGNADVYYLPNAWGTGEEGKDYINYDKVDEAVFAYPGTAFKIPGISSLKNSINEPIDAAEWTDITAEIRVDILNNPKPTGRSFIDDFDDTAEYVIDLGKCDADGSIIVDEAKTKDLRIRPGVYQIEYSVTDFDGSTIKVPRPIIILSQNGDIDIDGKCDIIDSSAVRNRYDDRLPYEMSTSIMGSGKKYLHGRLYRYRICDTNDDGDINNADANCIDNAKTVTFYKNIPAS